MKKNFLTVAAIMVVAFFVSTEIAKAADISFSGQIRSRYEINERSDFNDATTASDFVQTRVRLNTKVKVNDDTSVFIQMQSSRTWGGTGFTDGLGSGNAAATASDADASVGLHEAYFTLKNFATLPVDLKFGRQQVVLDGHRLFGHTGWTTGAQTHDAVRLTHAHDNISISYIWSIVEESGLNTDNVDDTEVHVLHASIKGVLGGKFSAIYSYVDDGCGNTAGNTIQGINNTANEADRTTVLCNNLPNNIHTIGFRQAGQLMGIDYRGEYYHQYGDAQGDAIAAATGGTVGVDRDAYMFGMRVGKAFKNVGMKPSVTLWYDYLSGTSDNDGRNNEQNFQHLV